MRSAPLNYLISVAFGGLLWLGTGYWVANYLKFNVSLGVGTTVDYFVGVYRIVLAMAGVIGLLTCFFWFYYGSQEGTASNLEEAKRVWAISFFVQLALSIVAVVTIFAIFKNAIFTAAQYAIFFAVMSAHTYLFYWLCTLVLSPRTVKYIPWGMR